MIEANYSDDILIENMCNDEMVRSLYQHHLELEESVKALKVNFCADTQNIILIHLSSANSKETTFIQRVKDELGFHNVATARANQIINLEKEEF